MFDSSKGSSGYRNYYNANDVFHYFLVFIPRKSYESAIVIHENKLYESNGDDKCETDKSNQNQVCTMYLDYLASLLRMKNFQEVKMRYHLKKHDTFVLICAQFSLADSL